MKDILGVIGNVIGNKFDYNSFDFLDDYNQNGLVRFGGITGNIGSTSYNTRYGICRVTAAAGYILQELFIFGDIGKKYHRYGVRGTSGVTWDVWLKTNVEQA